MLLVGLVAWVVALVGIALAVVDNIAVAVVVAVGKDLLVLHMFVD